METQDQEPAQVSQAAQDSKSAETSEQCSEAPPPPEETRDQKPAQVSQAPQASKPCEESGTTQGPPKLAEDQSVAGPATPAEAEHPAVPDIAETAPKVAPAETTAAVGVEDTVEVEVPEPDPIELAESKKQTDHPVGPKGTPSDPATLSNTMLPDKGPEAPVPTQLDTQQTLDPKDIDETKPGKGKAEKEQQFKEKKGKKTRRTREMPQEPIA